MLNVSEERINYIQKVIVLAQNRREEAPKNEERAQIIERVSLLWEDPEKYRESRKSHFEIVDFLMSLDLEDVKFLGTVMYMGRNDPSNNDPAALYESTYDTLQGKTKEIVVKSIVEKEPLDKYLEKGLSLLEKIQ